MVNVDLYQSFLTYSILGDSASARAILTGHETAVLCAAVSSSLGLVVSGSQGTIFYH